MPHRGRRPQTARRGHRYQSREVRRHQDGGRGAPGVDRGDGVPRETARPRQQRRGFEHWTGPHCSSGDVGESRHGQSPQHDEDDQDVPPPSGRQFWVEDRLRVVHCWTAPYVGSVVLCASNCGIEGYARVLRDELRVFDVQVSIINPGLTGTNLTNSSMQSVRDNFEACAESITKPFGLDYANRCCEHIDIGMRKAGMDDVSVPTECICKAVGSMHCGHR
ncbi:unnamed protein product [Laminaria digitata]